MKTLTISDLKVLCQWKKGPTNKADKKTAITKLTTKRELIARYKETQNNPSPNSSPANSPTNSVASESDMDEDGSIASESSEFNPTGITLREDV